MAEILELYDIICDALSANELNERLAIQEFVLLHINEPYIESLEEIKSILADALPKRKYNMVLEAMEKARYLYTKYEAGKDVISSYDPLYFVMVKELKGKKPTNVSDMLNSIKKSNTYEAFILMAYYGQVIIRHLGLLRKFLYNVHSIDVGNIQTAEGVARMHALILQHEGLDALVAAFMLTCKHQKDNIKEYPKSIKHLITTILSDQCLLLDLNALMNRLQQNTDAYGYEVFVIGAYYDMFTLAFMIEMSDAIRKKFPKDISVQLTRDSSIAVWYATIMQQKKEDIKEFIAQQMRR